MGTTIYPTVPVAQPEAEAWPVDDDPIGVQADEMFARQLDTAFSSGVRALLYASEAGIAAQSGEGRPPRSQDIDGIVNSEVSGLEVGDPKLGRKVGHATLRCADRATLDKQIAAVEALIAKA